NIDQFQPHSRRCPDGDNLRKSLEACECRWTVRLSKSRPPLIYEAALRSFVATGRKLNDVEWDRFSCHIPVWPRPHSSINGMHLESFRMQTKQPLRIIGFLRRRNAGTS